MNTNSQLNLLPNGRRVFTVDVNTKMSTTEMLALLKSAFKSASANK